MSSKTDKRWREMMASSAGKGTALRPMDKKKYNDNWDRVFGNAKDREENIKDIPPDLESFGQEKI